MNPIAAIRDQFRELRRHRRIVVRRRPLAAPAPEQDDSEEWSRAMRGMADAVAVAGAGFASTVRRLNAEENARLRLLAVTGPDSEQFRTCMDEARRRADLYTSLYAASRYGCPDESPFVSGIESVTDDVTRGRIP